MNTPQNIENWFNSRVKSISEIEFLKKFKTKIPKIMLSEFKHCFYMFPNATGVCPAILSIPTQIEVVNKLAIVLHDFGDNCLFPHWHLSNELAQSGISTLSVSLDGHSEKNSTFDLSASTRTIPLILQKLYCSLADDIFPENHSLPAVFLVANLAASTIALTVASRPEISNVIKGVIVVSPISTPFKNIPQKNHLLSFLNPRTFFKEIFPFIPYYGFFFLKEYLNIYKNKSKNIKKHVNVFHMEQLGAYIDEHFVENKLLEKIKIPILWIHNANDDICSRYDSYAYIEKLNAPIFIYYDVSLKHRNLFISVNTSKQISYFITKCV